MAVEQSVEWEFVGETEALGENLTQYHFVYHKSHMAWPGLEPGPLQWEAGDYLPELWHGPLHCVIRSRYEYEPSAYTKYLNRHTVLND
jgi:hypothetical protein